MLEFVHTRRKRRNVGRQCSRKFFVSFVTRYRFSCSFLYFFFSFFQSSNFHSHLLLHRIYVKRDENCSSSVKQLLRVPYKYCSFPLSFFIFFVITLLLLDWRVLAVGEINKKRGKRWRRRKTVRKISQLTSPTNVNGLVDSLHSRFFSFCLFFPFLLFRYQKSSGIFDFPSPHKNCFGCNFPDCEKIGKIVNFVGYFRVFLFMISCGWGKFSADKWTVYTQKYKCAKTKHLFAASMRAPNNRNVKNLQHNTTLFQKCQDEKSNRKKTIKCYKKKNEGKKNNRRAIRTK